MSVEREHWIAGAWGFAEATLFFFVPDVFLTWVALERPKRALVACGFALAGALLGGVLMFTWGGTGAESARTMLELLPGIRPDMFTAAHSDLADHGPAALFAGPRLGVPYKIYAVEWGALGGGLGGFVLVSIPARVLRFLLAAAVASLVRRRVLGSLSLRTCQTVHVIFWIAFYGWYFYVMHN